ncbi:MAG: uncharacterized protein QOJ88_1141 [Pyrinomonadaceae bacterium]|jgi:uncharacterized protein YggE|nr:uncharacterized protein [Pyrinomonadaceae bacterium]
MNMRTLTIRKLLTTLGLLATLLSTQAFAKEVALRGRLQRTVETGGWLIVSDNQKYLLVNATRFSDEQWFTSGNEVEAMGETKSGVVSIYLEGTPFAVRSMQPAVPSMQPLATATTTTTQNELRGLTKVMVTGDSIVQAQPDTAILTVSVVTQASRALDAQQQNADRTDAVVRALKNAAGAGAEIKTSGYSLQPQRVYKEGQPPTISGYEARNSVTVTLSDLSRVGPVIDATAQAGANDVAGISFTLRKDRPARDQALAEATREALSKAQVIATALGGRVVRIVEVQEEGVARPVPIYGEQMQLMRTASAPTPVEVGTLDITSRVQLIAEVEVGTR